MNNQKLLQQKKRFAFFITLLIVFTYNNFSLSQTMETVLPDLICTSISFSPTQLYPTDPINLSGYIKNDGNAPTGNEFRVNFYLSASPNQIDYRYFVHSFMMHALAAHQGDNFNEIGTVPSDAPPGYYYIWVNVDVYNRIEESNEDNNSKVSSNQFQVLYKSLPNLVCTSLSFSPNEIKVAGPINLSGSVTNDGDATTGSDFQVNFYLSTNPNELDPDLLLDSFQMSALDVNETQNFNRAGVIPAKTTPGYYYVWIHIDIYDEIAEKDERDNKTRTDSQVHVVLHELRVTAPNGGEAWQIGSNQTITWTSTGTSGNVKIEYSSDGGTNWTTIVSSTIDDGFHPWTIPNTPSTNCYVKISDTDGSPTDKSDAPFQIISRHFTPIWTGNPYQPMTIYCTEAMLNGQSLVAGDEIGIFDGNKCVGAKMLSQMPSQSNPVEIICSKDDGTGNGFTEGNTIIFKVWDQSAVSEYVASATFIDLQTGITINPVPFTGLGTAAVKLSGASIQSIALNAGWNIFSLAVTPQGNQNMLDVLSPILNSLVKVIDEKGNSIVKLFGNWTNSIGDWQSTEGYYINMKQSVTYQVTGTTIATPLTIPLYTGWNIISYPCLSFIQNAMYVVQPLINNGYLVKVIDEQGRSIIKIFGSWNNSIGDMHPGEGYYVNVNSNCTLTISCIGSVLSTSLTNQPESVTPEHFQLQSKGHPFEPMNIFVVEARVDGQYLNAEDEIAVYDGDQCVGASVVRHPLSVNTPLEIIASQDDGNGNGFKQGNAIRFKVWKSNTGEEVTFDAEGVQYLDPDKAELTSASMFEGFGTAVVAINLVTTSSEVEHVAMPQHYHLYQNHPNPFNPTTTISYDLPEVTDVRIEIYDLQGNVVRRLFEGQQDAGHHTIEWGGRNSQGSRVGSGIYFYKLISNKFVATKKMILTK